MKRIINGKKYDTETAVCVASDCNGLSKRDFNWCEETLYKKRTGEFFIHGEGGGLTPYAYHYPTGERCEGSRIVPLTSEQAKTWLENHDFDYIIEELWGPVEE